MTCQSNWLCMLNVQCTRLHTRKLYKKKWNGEVCDGDEWVKDSTFDEEMMEIRTLSFTHQKRWGIILLPQPWLWFCSLSFFLTSQLPYTFATECGWRHDTSCNVCCVCAAIFPISLDKIRNTYFVRSFVRFLLWHAYESDAHNNENGKNRQ